MSALEASSHFFKENHMSEIVTYCYNCFCITKYQLDLSYYTLMVMTAPKLATQITRTSPSQLSGQSDETWTDAPSPWWADRYHSGTERCPMHPGEVCVCVCAAFMFGHVCVCTQQQDRLAALSPPQRERRREKESERKATVGEGLKQYRIERDGWSWRGR